MFFSLSSAISLRQFDMASKAAFTDSRALRESPGIAMGSKRWFVSVDWVMADLLSLIWEERLSRESRVGPVVAWEHADHPGETCPYGSRSTACAALSTILRRVPRLRERKL